jgi:hypothetical protein
MIQTCEFPAAPRLPQRGLDVHVPEEHLVQATRGDVQHHVGARLLRQARNVQLEVLALKSKECNLFVPKWHDGPKGLVIL